MKKQRFAQKTVWITGATSGIGRQLALDFAAEGANVAVTGRREERLREVVAELEAVGVRGLAVPCDVTDEAQVIAAAQQVVDIFGGIDVAIANAGFGVAGKIADVSADEWRRQFDTNVIGLTSTARAALPELIKAKGRMVLIGSVSSFIAQPGVGPYHASKYAVRAIGQTLSMELYGTGATCTTIHPGFVQSEIGQVGNDGEFRADWKDKRPAKVMWTTENAARVMINAISRRKREFVFTGHGKAAAFIGRHAPGLVHFASTRLLSSYKRR